jgi:hypothetical protein
MAFSGRLEQRTLNLEIEEVTEAASFNRKPNGCRRLFSSHSSRLSMMQRIFAEGDVALRIRESCLELYFRPHAFI